MKKILILVALCASMTVYSQKSTFLFPNYDEVVTHFFLNYSVADVVSPKLLSFEKSPNGWFAVVKDWSEKENVIKKELLWDNKKNAFQKIAFDKLMFEGENENQIKTFKQAFGRQYYYISPYYGYSGWDWDVIQEYKDAKNLSDTLLYALGRAYSSYASNLLSNNSGLADNSKSFILTKEKNAMTPKQLSEYRTYRHLAIAKFKELSLRNPDFQTIVGAIGVKYSNEYVTSFLDLRLYQSEKEAMLELVDGLYNDFYISVAKNYLNSCEPNTILFTNGDNDTYPLLYVQAKLGFRTDVLVVNMSLLQTDRYVNSFRSPILSAPAIPLTLSVSDIENGKKDIIYIQEDPEQEGPLELASAIKWIKSEKTSVTLGNKTTLTLPTKKFSFTKGNSKMEWEISDNYITLNHLILMDVIATIKMERPISFVSSISSEYLFGLSRYLQLNGLVSRLVMEQSAEENDASGVVDAGKMYRNMMTRFDWSGFAKVSKSESILVSGYRYTFYRLADALVLEDKIDSAKKVLDKCLEVFPNEITPFDYYTTAIAEVYYRINQVSVANKVIEKIYLNLKDGIVDTWGDDSKISSEDKNSMLTYLKKVLEKYEQFDLLKELE